MTTFQPMTPNWLSGGWDQMVKDDPELELAYNYEDYPSEMSGEGNWMDLYLTTSNEFPICRVWLNPETENIGVQYLPGGNDTHATRIALQLREFNHNGVDAIRAFDFVTKQYYAGNWKTGELSEAATGVL